MILFSLFYFVPENEKDMFSGFGLFRAGIVHFRRKKRFLHKLRPGLCIFEGKKGISAKSILIKKMHWNGGLE